MNFRAKNNLFSVLSQHSTSRKDEIECVTSLDNCPHQHYKHGDGFCDDDMNIPECDYDGQDCCRESVIDYFCIECRCYESGCEGTKIDGKNDTTTQSPLDQSENQNVSYCIRPQWVGDGECDQVCNTEWCEYDGGDCEGVDPVNITMPNCPAEFWVNNGKCDDEVNIPECDYDGGDCCLEPYVQGFCTICVCYDD